MVAVTLAQMDPEDADGLLKALADPVTYTTSGIARVLARRGFDVHYKRIAQHRKGECGCY